MKKLFITLIGLIILSLLITCKKNAPETISEIDQPISVSITVDGKTSVEAGVR